MNANRGRRLVHAAEAVTSADGVETPRQARSVAGGRREPPARADGADIFESECKIPRCGRNSS